MEYSTEIFYKIVLIAALIWFIPVPVLNFKQKRIDAMLEDRIKHKLLTSQEKIDYVNFNNMYKKIGLEKYIRIDLDYICRLKNNINDILKIVTKIEDNIILYPAYVDGIQVQRYEKEENINTFFIFKKENKLYRYELISCNKIEYIESTPCN